MTIVNGLLLERIAAECLLLPPDQWMKSIGMTYDGHQWLRETAETSVSLGTGPGSIRMVGFQLGFETARELHKSGELL